MSTTVKTQEQLDKALADKASDIIIDSLAGVWLEVWAAYDSSTVRASGSSTVRAYDSSTVWASGSSTVWAYDSSTVWASGSSTVWAYDSSTVRAYGSSTVRASKYVAVHLFSQQVKLDGGVLIDMTAVDPKKLTDWSDLTGVQPLRGWLTVYKAVDADLRSGQGFQYPIGKTVTDTAWRDDNECRRGLHCSPTAVQAKDHFEGATRFLECKVKAAEVRCIDSSKLKAPSVKVIREVDLFTHKPVKS